MFFCMDSIVFFEDIHIQKRDRLSLFLDKVLTINSERVGIGSQFQFEFVDKMLL